MSTMRVGLIAVDFQSSKVLSVRPCCYRGELLSPLVSWVNEGGPQVALPPQKSVLMGAEESRGRGRQELNQDLFYFFFTLSIFHLSFLIFHFYIVTSCWRSSLSVCCVGSDPQCGWYRADTLIQEHQPTQSPPYLLSPVCHYPVLVDVQLSCIHSASIAPSVWRLFKQLLWAPEVRNVLWEWILMFSPFIHFGPWSRANATSDLHVNVAQITSHNL